MLPRHPRNPPVNHHHHEEPPPDSANDTGWSESDGQWPMRPVDRLIYASLSRVDRSVLDEMRRIRDHAVRNNGPDGLRVGLMHMNGHFIEWIEGPGPAIDALMARVSRDPRHHGLQVIHRSTGQARLKRPWIGAIVQAIEPPSLFAARVHTWRLRHEAGQVYEPAHVWMNVCSPPAPDMPRAGEGAERVMLLSARLAWAFDLLRWLAGVSSRRLVQRRYAASADDVPDVASDYLDLPDLGPGGMRLIAHARRGLTMGVAHALMPAHGAVVLILDGDAEANVRLVQKVLDVCNQTQHVPTIIGVGPHDSVTAELADRVQANGHAWIGVRSPLARPDVSDLWAVLEPVLDQFAGQASG